MLVKIIFINQLALYGRRHVFYLSNINLIYEARFSFNYNSIMLTID